MFTTEMSVGFREIDISCVFVIIPAHNCAEEKSCLARISGAVNAHYCSVRFGAQISAQFAYRLSVIDLSEFFVCRDFSFQCISCKIVHIDRPPGLFLLRLLFCDYAVKKPSFVRFNIMISYTNEKFYTFKEYKGHSQIRHFAIPERSGLNALSLLHPESTLRFHRSL